MPAAAAYLDEQAAVIELARHYVHIVVSQEHPEALGAPPRHLHGVLHACSAADTGDLSLQLPTTQEHSDTRSLHRSKDSSHQGKSWLNSLELHECVHGKDSKAYSYCSRCINGESRRAGLPTHPPARRPPQRRSG